VFSAGFGPTCPTLELKPAAVSSIAAADFLSTTWSDARALL
jgi:hypothetical protein